MAICGNCGAETRRVRTVMTTNGGKTLLPENQRKDECPVCAPDAFPPAWLTARGVMGWEAYAEKYDKIELPDGRIGYRAKEEFRQDTEDRIRSGSVEEQKKYAAALERKRQTRRTAPMTEDEIRARIERIRPVYEDRQEQANQRFNRAVREFIQ